LWHGLIVAAYRAVMKPQTKKSRKAKTVDEEGSFDSWWEGPLPDETSENEENWELVVEWLSNRALWDDGGYEMEDDIVDADPKVSGAKKALMGIDEGCFSEVAPDLSDSQMETIRQTLRDVCGRG